MAFSTNIISAWCTVGKASKGFSGANAGVIWEYKTRLGTTVIKIK